MTKLHVALATYKNQISYRRSVKKRLRHGPNILHTIIYRLDTNSIDNKTVER